MTDSAKMTDPYIVGGLLPKVHVWIHGTKILYFIKISQISKIHETKSLT